MANEQLSNFNAENPAWTSLSHEDFGNKKAYADMEAPENKVALSEENITESVEAPESEFAPAPEDTNLAENNVNDAEKPASEFSPIPEDANLAETNINEAQNPDNKIPQVSDLTDKSYDDIKKSEGEFNPNPDDNGPEEGMNFNSH